MSVLLEARALEKQYRLGGGRVLHAVSDVSLQVHRGRRWHWLGNLAVASRLWDVR